MANISIGSGGPDRIPPLRGTIPINATFRQYIPIVDDDGARIDLTDYDFELAFRDRDNNVALRLSTVTGEITKTTDDDGDTLLVTATPTVMANLCGAYRCSFAAKDSSDVVYILADGNVVFSDVPTAFA